MAHSLAPSVTEVEKFPMWSSVIFPTSLSRTSTLRVAVLGTFRIFHSSFHTGDNVSGLTVELFRTLWSAKLCRHGPTSPKVTEGIKPWDLRSCIILWQDVITKTQVIDLI